MTQPKPPLLRLVGVERRANGALFVSFEVLEEKWEPQPYEYNGRFRLVPETDDED